MIYKYANKCTYIHSFNIALLCNLLKLLDVSGYHCQTDLSGRTVWAGLHISILRYQSTTLFRLIAEVCRTTCIQFLWNTVANEGSVPIKYDLFLIT